MNSNPIGDSGWRPLLVYQSTHKEPIDPLRQRLAGEVSRWAKQSKAVLGWVGGEIVEISNDFI